MADITPPDFTSAVGRVRKYIPDITPLEDPKNPSAAPSYYFSDIEIAAYMVEYSTETEPKRSAVKRAAADVIDVLANNEALVLKKIKTEDLETDGAKVADSLRRGSQALRKQADDEEVLEGNFFEVIPFYHYHPQTRMQTRIW
jgi:hypothetical protein